MSHLKKLNPSTRFLLLVCALLIVSVSIFALRGVSASALSRFGITEQRRVDRLIGKVASTNLASKSTETVQGEAALKLLKDRGQ